MKANTMTCGEKIREARKQNGLSQEELAKKLCVSRPVIAKWESNRGMPDIENLKTISKLFDISIDYLVADSDIAVCNVLKQPINLNKFQTIQLKLVSNYSQKRIVKLYKCITLDQYRMEKYYIHLF